jgi:hypothetical protein
MQDQAETPGRFKNVGFAAISAGFLTLFCIIVGQTAEKFAGSVTPTNSSLTASADTTKIDASTGAKAQFNTIDYATTGSIKGQTVIISPCTGEKTVQ